MARPGIRSGPVDEFQNFWGGIVDFAPESKISESQELEEYEEYELADVGIFEFLDFFGPGIGGNPGIRIGRAEDRLGLGLRISGLDSNSRDFSYSRA